MLNPCANGFREDHAHWDGQKLINVGGKDLQTEGLNELAEPVSVVEIDTRGNGRLSRPVSESAQIVNIRAVIESLEAA